MRTNTQKMSGAKAVNCARSNMPYPSHFRWLAVAFLRASGHSPNRARVLLSCLLAVNGFFYAVCNFHNQFILNVNFFERLKFEKVTSRYINGLQKKVAHGVFFVNASNGVAMACSSVSCKIPLWHCGLKLGIATTNLLCLTSCRLLAE